MKKTLITFIAVLLSLAGAHAQSKHVQTHLWRLDSLTLDSMYNHWYTYAQEHPQDEVAWRNVYDVYKCYEHYLVNQVAAVERLPKARKEMLQKMGFMEKMKQAIPDSYTYNICTFDIAHYYVHPTDNSYDVYLDRVIEKLPDYDDGYDYDPLVSIFVERDDSVRLKKVLDLYFQSGFYPSEELQYNYNELQGMEEGAVYIASHDGNVNGKLILQHVLGVRPDVIIFNENYSYGKEYVSRVFQRIGIPINDSIWIHDIHNSLKQEDRYSNILRYIFEHSKRPVYLSANAIKSMSNGWGLTDDMKANLYNEGLTMRYSAKPYDNMAVKRRNVEERYRMEYALMGFEPQKPNRRHFNSDVIFLANNYNVLLCDLLPYYEKHDKERYKWLKNLLDGIKKRVNEANEKRLKELKKK